MSGKQHTTNYADTFIQVAEDCPASTGLPPPERAGKPTVAGLQYEMIVARPYRHTSDDVVFATSAAGRALGKGGSETERRQAREVFFSKGQACLRASPLAKQYGWGIHADAKGRVALHAVDSADYRRLASDPAITQVRAMRSKRA